MMPIKDINKLVFTDSYWFPHWEDIEANKYKKIPGSRQMMRLVHIKVSKLSVNFLVSNINLLSI